MALLEWLFRTAVSVVGRGRLVILTYHRVLPYTDSILSGEPDASAFEAQMRFLQRNFNVMDLAGALDALYSGEVPPRAAAITFDDGYANNYTVALPILRRLGLPATFFIASGYLDGGRMWNDTVIESLRAWRSARMDLSAMGLDSFPMTNDADRRSAMTATLKRLKHLPPGERNRQAGRIAELAGASLPDDLMMTSAQVRELSEQGMDIGGHTVTHPILAAIDDDEVRQEVMENRAHLVALTGKEPRTFAYPNGTPGQDFRPEHPGIVLDCGYDYALTTAWGAANVDSAPGLVPRVGLWSRTPAAMTRNLLRAYR